MVSVYYFQVSLNVNKDFVTFYRLLRKVCTALRIKEIILNNILKLVLGIRLTERMIHEVPSVILYCIFVMSLRIFSHSGITAQVTVFLNGQIRNPSPRKILL